MRTRSRAISNIACLVVLATLALAPAAADAASGRVQFMRVAASEFESVVRSPTATASTWMRDHYFRMLTWAPYFDSRLAWYPNAWAYEDAYAIYPGEEAGLEQYILKDSTGRRLYLPYKCANGTCPQYAADFGDPGWRQHFINVAKARAAAGYKGIFVDDVNFTFHVGDGYGRFVAPIDRRTNAPMTHDDWQRYLAEFLEQLRAALPASFEIVQNQVWFHAGGLSNGYVRRAIEASTHLEIERGVIDTGIAGGSGQYGFETVLAWADYAHSRGKGVIWDANAGSWGREYQVATYLLTSNGLDAMSHLSDDRPDNWWSGYDTDLGEALGRRYAWNGVLRRDFEKGIVLVNQPGQTTKTLALGGGYEDLAGTTVNAVTLAAREASVLLTAPAPPPVDATPPPVDSTTPPVDATPPAVVSTTIVEKALGKPASASSNESTGLLPGNGNDTSLWTRWSSAFADNQWWQVDLERPRAVEAVKLTWETAYARTYKIQTSTDGVTFTDAASVTIWAPIVQSTWFPSRLARYVRILGVTRATPWGFSLWDAKVYGIED